MNPWEKQEIVAWYRAGQDGAKGLKQLVPGMSSALNAQDSAQLSGMEAIVSD